MQPLKGQHPSTDSSDDSMLACVTKPVSVYLNIAFFSISFPLHQFVQESTVTLLAIKLQTVFENTSSADSRVWLYKIRLLK